MATLKEFRLAHPEYDDLDDGSLANSLHEKFYKDIPKSDFYKTLGIDNSDKAVIEEATIGGEFTKGFARGVDQAESLIGTAVKTAGRLLGDRTEGRYKEILSDVEGAGQGYEQRNIGEARQNPAAVQSYRDVGSVGDAARYAAGALGEGVPMMAPSIAGGVAGAVVGGPVGAIAGAMLPGYALNTGEMVQNFEQEGLDRPGLAALVGVPLSALDSLTPASIVSKLVGKGVAENVAKRVAQGAAKGFLTEGATEGAQEALGIGAVASQTGKDPLTRENVDQVLDAAIKGGLTGGVMEGGASAFQRSGNAVPPTGNIQPPPPSSAQPGFPPVPSAGPQASALPPSANSPAPVQQPVVPPTQAAPGPVLSPQAPAPVPQGAVEVLDPESGDVLGVTTAEPYTAPDGTQRFKLADEIGGLGKDIDLEDAVLRPLQSVPPLDGGQSDPVAGGSGEAIQPSPVEAAASAPTLEPIAPPQSASPISPDTVPQEGLPSSVPSVVSPDTVPQEGLPAVDPNSFPPSPVSPDTVPQEGLPAVDPNPFPPSPVQPDTVPQEGLPASVPSNVTPDTVPGENLPDVDPNEPSKSDNEPFKALRLSMRDDILVKGMTAASMRFKAEQALGVKVPPNSVVAKQVEEQAEAAVSELANSFATLETDPVKAFEDIVELYDRQPKLMTRTGDSARRQAFSTPAPLGYVVSKLAGIDRSKTVYEPTAGTGMLVQGADPKKVFANEIDENRASILKDRGFTVRQGDALTSDIGDSSDVVVSNPPFGMTYDDAGKNIVHRVKMRNGQEFATTDIGHAIAMDAVTRKMKQDGRAVIVIGSKYDPRLEGASEEVRDKARADRYKVGNTRLFYKNLFRDYNVSDHFTVAGDLYAKQGTMFPVDVIVINGARVPTSDTDFSRPLPAVNLPRVMTTWDQLKGLIDGTPVDGMGTTGSQPGNGGATAAAKTEQDVTDRVPVPPKADEQVSDAGERGEGAARGDGVQKADEGRTEPDGAGRRGGRSSGGGSRTVRSGNRGSGGKVSDTPDGRPPATPDAGSDKAGGSSDSVGTGQRSGPDLSSMFDDVLDEVAPPKPSSKRADAPTAPKSAPPAPSVKASAKATERGAGEAAISAAKNTTQAALDALDGLAALLGKAPGRLGSGLNFDAETYAAAKPLFKSSLENIARTGTDLRDMMKAIIRFLHDVKGVERDVLKEKFQPLVVKFMQEVQDGTVVIADPPADAPTMEQLIEAAKPQIETVPEPVVRENRTTEPKKGDAETEFQVAYKSKSKTNSVGSLSPKRMQDAMDAALTRIEDDYGDIDSYVADNLNYPVDALSTYFSAEQVDALALAIDNVDRNRGFIIGDQTGVGKGRFVAAMLRYAQITGKTPVFITQKPGLYKDMVRDLTDIGMADAVSTILTTNRRGTDRGVTINPDTGEMLEFRTNAEQNKFEQQMKDTGRLPSGYKMLFTTYDQMNYSKGGKVDKGEVIPGVKYLRQEAMEALAPNAMLVLDESHSAGGSPGNDPRVDNRDKFFRELVRNSAGSVFSSATYAKNPHNMTLYSSTDMALAVDNPEKLASAIEAGGVPLQQVVARGLVAAGQMVRRERSWDGIEVKTNKSAVDKRIASDFSGLLQEAFYLDQRFKDVKEEFGNTILPSLGQQLGNDPALNPAQVGFSNIMHNLIGQALLAIKTQAVAEYALDLHAKGEKVIVTVSSTMEGALSEIMEAKGIKPGESITGKVSFNDVFEKYMGRMRTAIVRNDADPDNPHRIYITDDMMRDMGFTEALEDYNLAIRKVRAADLKGLPISPIDDIKDRMKAGGMKVGEITGRSVEVVKGRTVSREKGINAKIAAMNGFNTGTVDSLVINRSGATGFSLHASDRPEVTDKRPRHMVVAQPEADVNDFMQMLGRINRTGQIVKPTYTLFFSDLPAERRPTAQLLKKLASLNANTSANAEGNFGVADGADFQNKYGGEVVGQLLRDEPDIAAQLDIRIPGENQRGDEALLNRFMGRAQILDPVEQERLFGMLVENYNSLIENLNATGQNTLEAKEMDVDGKVISTVELEPAKGSSGSVFEEPAVFELVDMKRLTKPMTIDNVKLAMRKAVGAEPDAPTADVGAAQSAHKLELSLDLENGWLVAVEDIQARQAAADADLEAERAKATEEKPNLRKIDAAAQKAKGLQDLLEATNANRDFLGTKLSEFSIGKAVKVESGTGENLAIQLGYVVNVENRKAAKNPMALSNYVWTIQTSRDSKPMKISASQISSGAMALAHGNNSEVLNDFERNLKEGREKRGIITGNILAGYSKLGNKGTITSIRMADGSLKDAVLMPPNFNLEAELARLPVKIDDPEKIATFVSEVALTRSVRSPGGQNEGVHINMQRSGDFFVLVKPGSRRDRPLYTSEKVEKFLTFNNIQGGGGFVKRKDGYSVRIPQRKTLEGLLKIYQDDFGVEFVAAVDTARARELNGDKPIDAKGFEFTPGKGTRTKDEVKQAVRAAWQEVGLPLTRAFVTDKIEIGEGNKKAAEASLGREMKAGEDRAAGGTFHDDHYGVVALVSMDSPNARSTAFHEAFHVLQDMALTAEEKKVLVQATPRLKRLAADAILEPAGSRAVENLSREELEAYAFQRYMEIRDLGMNPGALTGPLHGIWSKLYEFMVRLRNALRGLGFVSPSDIFQGAATGRFGERVPATTPEALETYKRLAEPIYFAFQPPANPNRTPQTQAVIDKLMGPAQNQNFLQQTRQTFQTYKTWSQRLDKVVFERMFGMGFREAVVDSMDPIMKREIAQFGSLNAASNSPYKAARMTRNLGSAMAMVFKHGPLELVTGGFKVKGHTPGTQTPDKGLEWVFSDLAKNGLLDEWKAYRVGTRAQRLKADAMAAGRKVTDFLPSGVTEAELLAMRTPANAAIFDEADKRFNQFNDDMLEMAVKAGILSASTKKVFTDTQDYIPFYRILEASDGLDHPMTKGGLADQRGPFMRIKGSDKYIQDPIHNITLNYVKLVDASFKNRAMYMVKDLAVASGAMQKMGKAYTNAIAPMWIEKNRKELERIGFDWNSVPPQTQREMLNLISMTAPTGPDIVSLMVNGKPVYYKVIDDGLLRAVRSLNPGGFSPIIRFFGKGKNILTRAVTVTPTFLVRNTLRDTLSAWVTSNTPGFRPVIGAIAGFGKALKENESLQSIAAAGGGTGAFYGLSPDDMTRHIYALADKGKIRALHAPRRIWEAYEKVGRASEVANRIEIFEKTLKAGGDQFEAAYQAMDIMDFASRGSSGLIRNLTEITPFLNARIQGLDRLARGASDNPARFAIRGAILMGLSLALMALNDDDERYKELEDWNKDANYHFWIGDQHFQIPKPFEVGLIFSTVPERAYKTLSGTEDYGDLVKSLGLGIGQTLAFNPATGNPITNTYIEQKSNTVSFTGRPIETLGMDRLEPQRRAGPYTTDTAQIIGEALPATGIFDDDYKSPVRIEAFIRGFLGSLGLFALKASDSVIGLANPNEKPAEGAFSAIPGAGVIFNDLQRAFMPEDKNRTSKFVTEFYELSTTLDKATATMNDARKDGDDAGLEALEKKYENILPLKSMISKAKKQLTDLNKESIQVRNDRTLDAQEKKAKLDEINGYMKALAADVMMEVEAMKLD